MAGHPAQIVVVGVEAFGRLALRALDLRLLQPRCYRTHHACGHLVLQIEQVFERTLKAIRPQMRAGRAIDELPGDTHAVRLLADAAFEHVTDTQLARRLLDTHGAAFVGETRVPRDDEQPAHARERRYDVLHHAVSEILLLRIATHVLKRQHGDRWLVGQAQCWPCRFRHNPAARVPRHIPADAKDPQRPRDVLDRLLSQVLEVKWHLVADLVAHGSGYADATRLGQLLEPCRHIDAVAMNVLALDDDVTKIDTHAIDDLLVFGLAGIALTHRSLHRDRAADRLDHARKLNQNAVAGGLDDSPVMLANLWIDQLAADGLEPRNRSLLVRPHQPAVAGNVSGQYGREFAFDTLG